MANGITKLCKGCDKRKRMSFQYIKDNEGHDLYCVSCRNNATFMAIGIEKQCAKCRNEHIMTISYINRRLEQGKALYCKNCRTLIQRAVTRKANKKESRKGSFLSALQAKGLNLK